MSATGLDQLLPRGRGTTGIVCVHCQGKRFDPQHYDERSGWSDEHAPCATCQGTGRIYTVEQYLKTLPADWHQDSRLETWFPLLSEELKRLESERDALRAENERLTRFAAVIPALVELIERCASECAECEGTGLRLKEQPSPDGEREDCPDCADLRSALTLASSAAAAE
ncbi:MAG: hypothetical protein ACYCV6_03110 [Steroidobacteraceae bacterium]